MNTKKNKNKQKQHKPPTPQPKPEASDDTTAKSGQIGQQETELIKSEVRVPEIVSEVVQPILEPKGSESDGPKKPKRNRGKKKKSDKGDDTDVVQEQEIDEPVLETSKNLGDIKKCIDITATEGKEAEASEITPAARKKKNKNKKQTEQSDKITEQDVIISPIKKVEDLTDLKIITVVPVTTETSEESKSKKKNKKKKRTDSERSDKAEEIPSCTAAFQKLLENKDERKGVKEDNNQEDNNTGKEKPLVAPLDLPKDQAQAAVSENPVTDTAFNKEVFKTDIAVTSELTEIKSEPRDEGGKGKKKNKRDKKHHPKEESEDESIKPLQTKTERDSEGQTVTVATDIKIFPENITHENKEVIKIDEKNPIEPLMSTIEKEKSPKPKAQIAKPVEKKRIEKVDVSSNKNVAEKGSTEETLQATSDLVVKNMIAEIKPISDQPVVKPVAVELIEEMNPSDVEKKSQPILISDDNIIGVKADRCEFPNYPTDAACKTDKIELPEIGTSKKRKKSPKPKQKPALIPEAIASDDKQSLPVTPEIPVEKEVIQIKETKTNHPEPKIVSQEPIPLSLEVTKPQESTQINISEPSLEFKQEVSKNTEESTPIEIDVNLEKLVEKENIQVPEVMGKKRKKSPKPQKKPEKAPEVSGHASSIKTSERNTQKNKQDVIICTPETITVTETPKQIPLDQIKTESISDLPALEDIEIRSIKADESEGSTCDITPDIHYPRASSQLLDDNNNTVIRDVTAIDVKLNIPANVLDIPLIQGSGETPLPLTGENQPGVTITEMTTPIIKQEDTTTTSKSTEKDVLFKTMDEKTDLKSKVLDVNQGMEELRRSIERSLAELSSMEKSGKEAEEQFFKAQVKLEQITEMATKKSEDKKQALSTVLETEQTKEKAEEIQNLRIQQKTSQENITEAQNPFEESKSVPKAEEAIVDTASLHPLTSTSQTNIEEPKQDISAPPETHLHQTPPVPARKDNKGKGKKKKGKQDFDSDSTATTTTSQRENISSATSTTTGDTKESTEDTKKDGKSEQKSDDNTQEKGKKQSDTQNKGKQKSASLEEDNSVSVNKRSSLTDSVGMGFEPIESFEDALYASVDENETDVNKTFEMIANEAVKCDESQNPKINVTGPVEDEDEKAKDKKEQEKINPLSQPKNLLGHPDIPARLNRTDYKKEKNKHQTPNTKHATVKIKDAVPIEVTKESKESQTENKRRFLKDKTVTESITSMCSENEEYIYKYSFRKVFLPSACHVCKKELNRARVPCNFCSLVFYCSVKHKDEDYPQHQGLCFAVSTIVHLKDQKHIYADAKNITGHEYRLLRMQMIISCEKVLKRRLVPWEQEALLYPRICADVGCREWRQNKLVDCDGCGQISYCSENPTHLPKTHQRWCKSYSLYNKLVVYQQTKGRLEPKFPTRVMAELCQIPGKLNEVLASMYEEKIDMTDIQYAALTQIATAPLTAAYCHQLYTNKMNTIYANGVHKKSSFTIHVVGAELQFEADALNKWEVFFLHLRPDVKDLRVVLIGPDLNPSKLPLDLLSKIKLCENCNQNKRRVLFDFQDRKTYYEYWSTDFITPDLVCTFNPGIQRSSVFNGKDIWPSTIKCILKLKVPFIITSYTMSELQKDLARVKECSDVDVNTISEAEFNSFASVRPDRNFITDDEMPLLFKNYCFATVCGAF